MIELRPVFYFLGILLMALAAAMLIPALVDSSVGNPDWEVFAASAAVTFFVGTALMLVSRG
ncbi:MAG TPA: potassium transporter TrkH, partial [Alphaproteobacteria bacterium]|nr:potassium transporter TrkH [Alphaproteobacteria bacterium]